MLIRTQSLKIKRRVDNSILYENKIYVFRIFLRVLLIKAYFNTVFIAYMTYFAYSLIVIQPFLSFLNYEQIQVHQYKAARFSYQ